MRPNLRASPFPDTRGGRFSAFRQIGRVIWRWAQMVRVFLIEHGADRDRRGGGRRRRTDAAALGGEQRRCGCCFGPPGGRRRHRGGRRFGTPLDNAAGYGCWNVAQLLAGHGARVDKLGTRPPWAGWTGSRSCSSRDAEGERDSQAFWHAQPLNAEPRSGFLERVPTSTGRRTTAAGRRSTQRAPVGLVERTSSSGSRNSGNRPHPRGLSRSQETSAHAAARASAHADERADPAGQMVRPRVESLPDLDSSAGGRGLLGVLCVGHRLGVMDPPRVRQVGVVLESVGRGRARIAGGRLPVVMLRGDSSDPCCGEDPPRPRRRRSMGWCDCGVCRRCSWWWTFLVCWAKRSRWTPRWR